MKNPGLLSSLLLLLMLFAAPVAAQNAWRWVDDAGKVHYGDRPPLAVKEKAEAVELYDQSVTDATPNALRVAMKEYPVTLHVSENCGSPCTLGTEYLDKRGVPYTLKKLSTAEDVEALSELLGGAEVGVPSLQVSSKAFKGYQLDAWRSMLDAAGYPDKEQQ